MFTPAAWLPWPRCLLRAASWRPGRDGGNSGNRDHESERASLEIARPWVSNACNPRGSQAPPNQLEASTAKSTPLALASSLLLPSSDTFPVLTHTSYYPDD